MAVLGLSLYENEDIQKDTLYVILYWNCSSFISVLKTNSDQKQHRREKGLFGLQVLVSVHHIWEVKVGIQAAQHIISTVSINKYMQAACSLHITHFKPSL